MIRLPLLLGLLPALVGCTASSRQLVPLPDQDVEIADREQCRVYIARYGEWHGSPRGILVYDGEQPIGILEQETYLCWERAPGHGLLRVVFKDQKLASGDFAGQLEVDYVKGEVRYVQVVAGTDLSRPLPRLIDPEQGAELIAGRRSPDED